MQAASHSADDIASPTRTAIRTGKFGRWHKNMPLSSLSYWKVGGRADLVVWPRSIDQLGELLGLLSIHQERYVVIGRATNLLISSAGVHCICIQLLNNFSQLDSDETGVTALSGAWTPRLAVEAARRGLGGIEHIAGIPGSFGGLITMNGGSLRKNIGSVVESVSALSPSGELRIYNQTDCAFEYRRSRFKASNEIIVSARLHLEPKPQSKIYQEMLEIMAARKAKFPLRLPNCGSVFMSDPVAYANFGPPGFMIEQCDLKGLRSGDAEVSPLHANFIVNHGMATSNDILHLIDIMRKSVQKRFGVSLHTEALFMDETGLIKPIDEMLDTRD
ncbi:UDP-N-acetylmuramate dehydrogenase [Sphingosinicella xenopeptidilytica]|uniref:UDP-N-acetylenolpyruvoylglucosamine reductase n=1 Tax=Sphingosinicella xenopeptidilytica TaxID=364098 RepID=A0ABW3C4A0_SPHXN